MTISVVLIEDNKIFRKGVFDYLRITSDINVVGLAKNAIEGIKLTEARNPDVVVMDWVMPGMTGLEATRLMVENIPGVRVVMLTMHADVVHVQRAIESGVRGYIIKDDTTEHLVPAIKAVAAGKEYYSPRILPVVNAHRNHRDDLR